MIIINPTYESLREWIEQLPNTFSTQGKIIYNARNQIRIINGPDGKVYNVKRYCCPKWYNRIIYTWFRTPKAIRAYQNALTLQQKAIPTPTPIAYILCGNTLLDESYLITEQSPLSHMLYELGDGIVHGREQMIAALGVFAATMHEKGILHLDFSPGNVLFDFVDNQWVFTLVDINRMRFGQVNYQVGCRNMARLWGGKEMYHILAEAYAKTRQLDAATCYQLMWQAHHQFWKGKKQPKSDFPVVLE
ncbi:MAG: lipopolysaccharide kinase InaA family protein [Paludibacteraceae bacterium]|nr:lipopolysaccharide kinase InaA family protein [Paludibacteraceae bacterium]